MKKKISILNIVLLICLSGSMFGFQPVEFAQASPSSQTQNAPSGLIAYIGKDGNAWLVNSDGSGKQQLTFDGGYEELVWAPDGQHLALTGSFDDYYQQPLYIKDLTSNPPQKLSEGVYTFAWDFQGNRIVYSSDMIHIYNIKENSDKTISKGNGTEKEILLVGETESLFWHMSGDSIIYYSGGERGIRLINIDTLSDMPLFVPNTDNGLGTVMAKLTYSPFTGHFWGWDYSSMERSWGVPVLITPDGQLNTLEGTGEGFGHLQSGDPTAADWSSDGEYVVYNNVDYLGGQIFVVKVNPYQLDDFQGDGINPRWSPDDKLIAFVTKKGSLKLLDINKQLITQLLPDVPDNYLTKFSACDYEGCPDPFIYSATSENEPRWSPDGKNIILPFKIGFFIYNLESKESKWVEGGLSPQWQPNKKFALSVISDLAVKPATIDNTSASYPITLSWEAESLDQISEFDVRMSDVPLTEATWNTARVIGVPSKPPFGNTVGLAASLAEKDLRTKLYFGVKTKNLSGEWSRISNVVEYMDSGFRSDLNGYQFRNVGEDWGTYPEKKTLQDYTEQDFYQMFKDNNSICVPTTNTGTNCKLLPWYSLWVKTANRAANAGRCLGMAVTSSIIYYDSSKLSRLGSGVSSVYDKNVNLDELNVRKFIMGNQVKWMANPYKTYFHENKLAGIQETLTLVEDLIKTRQGVILVFGVFNNEGTAHAVVPISIGRYPGKTIIYTYDNARPGITHPISIENGEWNYQGTSRSLPESFFIAVPIKKFQVPQSLDFFESYNVWFDSKLGSILIQNSDGKLVGTTNGVYVNEIPYSQITPIVAVDEFGNFEPWYSLPLQSDYEIRLKNVSDSENPNSLALFGLNYGILIEGVNLPDHGEDVIAIQPRESGFSYKANNGQILSIDLAAGNESEGSLIQLSNIKIDAGKELAVEYSDATAELKIIPASDEPFDLKITYLSSSGEVNFVQRNVQFADARQLTYDIFSWVVGNKMFVQLDYDGDGQFDEMAEVANQESFLSRIISSRNAGFVFCGIGFFLFGTGALGLIVVRRKRK